MISVEGIAMNDYQISYKISKHASIALITLLFIFLAGIVIKSFSLWISLDVFDIAYLSMFLIFFTFCWAAIWQFLIKKNPILSISSNHISVSVPYFFQPARIPLASVKEIKMSVWGRSEIIFFDAGDYRYLAFMAAFLSSEDRESFLSNIFDLIPNVQVT